MANTRSKDTIVVSQAAGSKKSAPIDVVAAPPGGAKKPRVAKAFRAITPKEARRKKTTSEPRPTAASGPAKRVKGSKKASAKKAPIKEAPANTIPPVVEAGQHTQSDDALARDMEFLAEMQRQVRKVRSGIKKPENHPRARALDKLQPFLDVMKPVLNLRVSRQVEESRSKHPPDAYVLSAADARHLLNSNKTFGAPVFVRGGANPTMFDGESDPRRPVEQMFDFFSDVTESWDTDAVATRALALPELRTHFLERKASHTTPWNFPDIPNPRLDTGVPAFVDVGNCTLLQALVRWLTDLQSVDICYPGCAGRPADGGRRCSQHFLSSDELFMLELCNRYWRSTLMLSDAGAATPSHYDKYGLGTWISCYEGEIGWAWISHASPEERVAWHGDNSTPCGRLVYTVLRPGDAMYMPPGTVHQVFRLPDGGQTLGIGGQLIRQPDVQLWLDMVDMEIDRALEEPTNTPYDLIFPGLLKGLGHFIGGGLSPEMAARYGGTKTVAKVHEMLERVEAKVKELVASR